MKTSFFTRFIQILDRLIFRIVPGLCFLAYIFRSIAILDEDLRSDAQSGLIALLYFLAIPFVASIAWWIFVPSAFDPPGEKFHEDEKSFVGSILVFFLSFGSLFYFSPPQTYFQYFFETGIFMYVSIFIADVFSMLRSALQEMLEREVPRRFSRTALFCLALYFIICLLIPAIFVMHKFFVQLLADGTSIVILFSLVLSFIIQVVFRYKKQGMKEKIV